MGDHDAVIRLFINGPPLWQFEASLFLEVSHAKFIVGPAHRIFWLSMRPYLWLIAVYVTLDTRRRLWLALNIFWLSMRPYLWLIAVYATLDTMVQQSVRLLRPGRKHLWVLHWAE